MANLIVVTSIIINGITNFEFLQGKLLVVDFYLCYYNNNMSWESKEQRRRFMEQFLTDDDLFGLLDELEQEEAEIEVLEGEMEASNRRFEEIIQKHKME